MVLNSSTINLIISLLGSSLLITGLTSFYNGFINKPIIFLEQLYIDQKNLLITAHNYGFAKATNFKLDIYCDENIENYDISTSENYTLLQPNSNTLNVFIPLFPEGDGSFANIDLSFSTGNSKCKSVGSTSEQGSQRAYIIQPGEPHIELITNLGPSSLLQIYLIYLGFMIVFVSLLIYTRTKQINEQSRRNKNAFSSKYKILKKVLEIRNHLHKDKLFKETFGIEEIRKEVIIKNFEYIQDFIWLEDFIDVIVNRNKSILNSKEDLTKIERQNKKCFMFANQILENSKWITNEIMKYTPDNEFILKKKVAILISILGGVFGLLGLGFLYIGKFRIGILYLVIGQIDLIIGARL